MYQVYPRSFMDADGDGVGDLRGITQRLDHLEALGVEVLWLSPVYRSPQDDNGYDISDYEDVDPLFGTLADLDELIAEARGRGIGIMMDLVVNHTSDEHAWFLESRSSTDNPKRDWYWWRAEPTNWGSWFGGPAWELDPATGEHYLHLFSRRQPDLNWENPEVRQAVYAMMNRWLDRGIAGFRMDVISLVSKVLPLRDGIVRPGHRYGDPTPYTFNGPRVHEFLQEMHREVFAGRDARLLTVGETPGVTVAEALLYTDPARGELDMVFHFEHMGFDQETTKWERGPLQPRHLKAVLGRWQGGLAEVGWNSLYWSNHDQPRIVSRFGDLGPHRERAAKALATVLHLHRGTPYVYQGEELGMTNYPFRAIEEFRDIESLNYYALEVASGREPDDVLTELRALGRDNARTPMQWDASPTAGFTRGEPWIAVNPNAAEVNAAAQRADAESVFHHYRRLHELRRTLPVVAHGDFTMLHAEHEHLYAFTRCLDGDELLVLGNLCAEDTTVALEGWEGAELVLGNVTGGGRLERAPASLRLAPWEARIYRRHAGTPPPS